MFYLEISVLEALNGIMCSTAEVVHDDATSVSAVDSDDVIISADDDCNDVTASTADFKAPVLSGNVISVVFLLVSIFNELESGEFVPSCSN